MKLDQIRALLPHIGSKFTGTRTGWVLCTCPMVWRHGGKRSEAFAVSVSPKKRSRVKCLSCGYSGDLRDVMFDVSFELKKHEEFRPRYNLALAASMINSEFVDMDIDVAHIPEYDEPVLKMEVMFPEQWLTSFQKIQKFPKAMHYCAGRGLSPQVLLDLDVRYDPLQERVCFPFRNKKNELMGLQGRYIGNLPTKDDKHDEVGILRYFQYGYQGHRNSHVWLGEEKLNLDMPVVTCEGPFDYAKIFMVYPNVAASFTSGLSRTKAKRVGDADSIITFYDFGAGGDNARHYLEKYLPNMPMLHIVPTEDEGDPGAMSIAVIRDTLKDHVELPLYGTKT